MTSCSSPSSIKVNMNNIYTFSPNLKWNTYHSLHRTTFYVFFWVFPRRPIVVCRRFGTLYQFHLQGLDVEYILHPTLEDQGLGVEYTLHPTLEDGGLDVEYTLHPTLEDGTDRGFRNVGKQQSDAGEIPKRIHTIFKTRRKFEIKNTEKHVHSL